MDDERKLASILPVEDRNQPLERIPLHRAFGRDPVRAAGTAGAVSAMRDIEDHGIRRRAKAADRRAPNGLAVSCPAREDGNEQTEKKCAKRVCAHDRQPLFEVLWRSPWQKAPLFSVVTRHCASRSSVDGLTGGDLAAG